MSFKQAFSLVSPAGAHARLFVLIFHRVFPERDPLFPDEPDIARFDEILGWVKQWFNVLPLEEAVVRLRSGSLPARAAAITFDDGYADNLTCAVPVLAKHGLNATFFIATGFTEGRCMWNDTVIESIRSAAVPEINCSFLGLGVLPVARFEEKRAVLNALLPSIKHQSVEMRAESVARIADACRGSLPDNLMLTREQLLAVRDAGMGLGAHSVTHPILASIDERVARQEIADSRDCLEEILGTRVQLFAYPNGKLGSDYSPIHAAMIRSLGFKAAFATNWGVCSAGSDFFQLPRFTPWDATRGRFALRLLLNTRCQDVALQATATIPSKV